MMTKNSAATGMSTAEIHKRWLSFFAERGHTVVPSASLVSDDPTLMFTVAGMVPFVPYLTGVVPAPYDRATSVQKCIRTNDIEEVGRTPRHGTFFQMCGNFSFGDYFKKEAIDFAWEFLTTPENKGGLGLDPKDLWVTVYEEDDEAYGIWSKIPGLEKNKIQKLGKDTNYWSTGQPGPAGPCSEIFFDRGPEYGQDGGPATDDDRYVEIWNLVFMQYSIDDVKSKTDFKIVGELPKKNIDTGLGLERVAFIKQGVENMYEIDQVRPVLDIAARMSKKTYGKNEANDVRLRIIADHVRSGLMLINDGVTPSNEGRGYILRRLLRRVILAMQLLGHEGPSFKELFNASKEAMETAYPDLDENFSFILQTVLTEEKTFLKTLSSGMQILDSAVETAETSNKIISGETAFLLHDTHGFPVELTLEIAEEAGVQVNEKVFKQLMQQQRDRAKEDAKSKRGQNADLSVYTSFRAQGETQFIGYEDLKGESEVIGIVVNGEASPVATEGQIAEVILSETTLWAEAGGQDSDQGQIIGANFELEVIDVQKPVQGLIVHTVKVVFGAVALQDKATTVVDAEYRYGAMQAHSGTHIVHAAIREVLGSNAHQAGSYNKAGYLRLDFTHTNALSDETKSEIEEISNIAIRNNFEVVTREMSLSDAKEIGAMALFGEKYGDTVRVVDIGGPWSRELCAGTHVKNSAEVAMINLVSESSIGSTHRRVESLVGMEAFQQFAAERAIIQELTRNLKVPRVDLVQRVHQLGEQLKKAEKKIQSFQDSAAKAQIPLLLNKADRLNKLKVIIENVGDATAEELRSLAIALRQEMITEAGVVVLIAVNNQKPLIVAATTQTAREHGVKAGSLISTAAKILGGGGGGKPDLAQGGGSDVSKITEALSAVRNILVDY